METFKKREDTVENIIKIGITGPNRSGKTAIVALIGKTLKDAGFMNVKIVNPEDRPEVIVEKLNALLGHRMDQVLGIAIELEEKFGSTLAPNTIKTPSDLGSGMMRGTMNGLKNCQEFSLQHIAAIDLACEIKNMSSVHITHAYGISLYQQAALRQAVVQNQIVQMSKDGTAWTVVPDVTPHQDAAKEHFDYFVRPYKDPEGS
jgi:hypothetical protein